ncbi:hypothetical protein BFJ63_vAg10685 [Fusarium oxysporum f. sp. narcissi]|uniref:Uncharacterized protein n=1 Tax=Fusarium oxysporum f. sp. narcissi TaxID=451672 RepID=A0A4Q2VF56_FUSOX|nr:hypothetical protein BFJ63_vAg10685 [Fusarium oxysporum f. sp. narcissi]
MKQPIKLVFLFALSDTTTGLSCGEKLGSASGKGELPARQHGAS